MKTIISLFQRNYDTDRLVRNEIVPGAEWVQAGEGIASRKFDGTCCMVKDGALYKRYDAKGGRTPPEGFIPAQDPDPTTGHWPGWVLVGSGPDDRYFREAWRDHVAYGETLSDGTYELVGPKINGNKDRFPSHVLIRHGAEQIPNAPTDYEGLKAWLSSQDIEGIVWHHPDGRMVKIKGKDFGYKR
jgi:hypothetical protein